MVVTWWIVAFLRSIWDSGTVACTSPNAIQSILHGAVCMCAKICVSNIANMMTFFIFY